MCFAIFPFHLSKVLRLPRKSDARSYEVLHLSRKIIVANLKIWRSKMQPLWGNLRPDLLTSLMDMSLVLPLPREMHICRSSSNVCHRFWTSCKTLTFCSLLARCRIPCACHAKRHLNVQKWSQQVVLFTFWRHVLRALFNISTSKSGPRPSVFKTFDFEMCFAFRHLNLQEWSEHEVLMHFDVEMCFAPQRHALFEHLNFQKCSEHEAFLAFWLGNVLRATTACNFSSPVCPRWLRTCRFSESTFRPSGATNH